MANFREAGPWNTLAHDASTKPVAEENKLETKLEGLVTSMQKQIKGRPDALAFVLPSLNGLTNIPQATSPVISIPTRGRGGSVRLSAPSSNLDVGFKPLIPKADENSFDEHVQPIHVNRHEANTVSSGMGSSEHVASSPSQINKTQNKNKLTTEENFGPLIPVTESELNSSQRLTTPTADKSVSTNGIFGPLKEVSKLPPHLLALKDSHSVARGRDVPTSVDSEAAALHGLNLVVIKDFARRADALRRGDTSAIATTDEEGEEGYEKSLPPVSY